MSFVNIFVLVMQYSYYITQFSFIPLGFLFRFLVIKKSSLTTGEKALVTLDFTSFSYFYLLKEKPELHKLYTIFLIVYSILAFLALGFGLNMYF